MKRQEYKVLVWPIPNRRASVDLGEAEFILDNNIFDGAFAFDLFCGRNILPLIAIHHFSHLVQDVVDAGLLFIGKLSQAP